MTTKNPLRINVGFIINLPVGESREFKLEIPAIFIKPDLHLQDLVGAAKFTRTAQGILTQVSAASLSSNLCVRCLNPIDLPLQTDFTELFAFSLNAVDQSELMMPEDGFIDLAPLLREYLILDIPISPLCRPDCKGLCPVCGENQNETTCHHEEDDIDPRLSQLKSLIDHGS